MIVARVYVHLLLKNQAFSAAMLELIASALERGLKIGNMTTLHLSTHRSLFKALP